MLEKASLSEHAIIDCLQNNYGISVATLKFLPLGADMKASVYRAETGEGAAYFVKIKLGHHSDISATLITLLHETGVQELILPLATHNGQLAQQLEDFTVLVFPFIQGQDGFSRDLSAEQWISLGRAMKKIHSLEVPPSIQAMIRREVYSPKWREAVRALYVNLESESQGDEIALNFIADMKKYSKVINGLVERAERLSQIIPSLKPEFVLCHSDIHGGNVLIAENGAIYIVDWDEPIMAPKERDLMFIGGGVANVWNKPQEEELFYRGYGKAEINKVILAYYRCERIVEDIALFGQHLLFTPADDQDRAESYQHFIAQFEPNGVVEMALHACSNID